MVRLQPRSIGQLLDGGFEVLRFRFRTIAIVASTILGPLYLAPQVLAIVLGSTGQGAGVAELFEPVAGDTTTLLTLTIVSIVGLALATMLLGVAVSHLVAAWLVGDDPGPADTLRLVGRRAPVAIGAWFLALATKALSAVACGLGLLYTVPVLQCLAPVVASEHGGVVASFRRTWNLGRPKVGRLMMVSGLWAASSYLVAQVAFIAAVTIADSSGDGSVLATIASSVTVAVTMSIAVVQTAVTALVYVDLRVRTEGLDLQMSAKERFGAAC